MAVGDANVFPGFLTAVLTQLSFQSHRLLFSHASAEVSGENTPERQFASTQVMSPTRSQLAHPGGACHQSTYQNDCVVNCFHVDMRSTIYKGV